MIPRTPNAGEDLIGKVCVCSTGRVAIVTGTTEKHLTPEDHAPGVTNGMKTFWTGLGLDGKGTWMSSRPVIIAEDGQEFHDRLLARFNGKMGFNA